MGRRLITPLLQVLVLMTATTAGHADPVTLGTALAKKMIHCSLTARRDPGRPVNDQPISLDLTLTNVTDRPFEVILAPGQRFESVNTLYQDLVLTEPVTLALSPGKEERRRLTTYCINALRKSPAGNVYRTGTMAGGHLLQLATWLGMNRIRSRPAQLAIWVITDKRTIGSVKGVNNIQTRQLRNYLYNLTGEPRPPRHIDPLAWPAVRIAGEIDWIMPAGGLAELAVLDSSDAVIGKLFEKRAFNQGPGRYNFTYMNDKLLPGSTYTLRLTGDRLLIKEMQVTAGEQDFAGSLETGNIKAGHR